jgi:hypothetical protein
MTSRTVLAVAGLPSRSSPERRAEAGDPTVRQLEPIESLVAPTGWPSPARVDARGRLVGCARWAGSLSALRVLENFPLYVAEGQKASRSTVAPVSCLNADSLPRAAAFNVRTCSAKGDIVSSGCLHDSPDRVHNDLWLIDRHDVTGLLSDHQTSSF